MNYWTMQIHYGSSLDPKVEERKDLSPGNTPESEWVRSLRENIFRTGFHIHTAPGTIQFVSPFLIHKVFLIKQQQKFGT